ncbi:tyrosine-type recombinase/integrase [Marinobacter daepoensis]|uniref:Tyrosine-type recombinase/integrase n=1 Tax=Marinobacter daepoensis TaxID=262077 RepID=A0ABS3BEE9_9GAMM|nr:tyrosine-type recombinase/integrase [Marinobacter daepoensis]MBN7769077.1 tyrosine-type recombinase/integrase [Marinobacter daepoensis]MBY6077767.1 tyrosine-type recombinase/integrase [Marinobacter daepoensis]
MKAKAQFPGFPLFDTADRIHEQSDFELYPGLKSALSALPLPVADIHEDFRIAHRFVVKYSDVPGTFNRFRGEIQRFLNYTWLIGRRTLAQADSELISSYFAFMKTPPASWVSRGIYSAFVSSGGLRQPNFQWRPMALRSKDTQAPYSVTQASLNASRTALQTFFKYLVSQDYLLRNPLLDVRKRDRSAKPNLNLDRDTDVRRLTDWQWSYLLESLTELASEDASFERHLFIIVTMKSLFLRVSELAPRPVDRGQWRTPTFGDFRRTVVDGEPYWVYSVFGKGDKTRQVTLPDAYLGYLKRWRTHLGHTSPLPVPGETSPILPSRKGAAIGKRQVQRIYEQAMVATADRMEREGYCDEARQILAIRSETHYLRHTGASQAIEAGADIRHISEELGHANATFTESVYVNAEQARRRSEGRQRLV